MAELLFWPALLAYGEAAAAYLGDARRPGALGRLGMWGVRLGWLAQTALLVAQAAGAAGFPWTTWAGSLNLFVWLVVSTYLFWGCRARYRLLGLAVMPLAVALLALVYLGGGVDVAEEPRYSTAFLVVHVGLVLAGFAGLLLAGALSALFLWQERRLKRHATSIFRLGAPALVTLDRFASRTVLVALPLLTLGILAGAGRLAVDGGRLDALMVVTILTWAVFASYVLLRVRAGWRGRRAALLAVAGIVLVLAADVGVSITHLS